MDIKQIITDYIRRSILTAEGDLVVRGASVPEALADVAVGQVLKSGGVGAKPAWGVPSISEIGLHIDAMTVSITDSVEETGFGFTPKLIIFAGVDSVAANNNHCFGIDLLTTQFHFNQGYNGAQCNSGVINSIEIIRDAGNHIKGSVSSFDVDGMHVDFVLVGACTVTVRYLAIG